MLISVVMIFIATMLKMEIMEIVRWWMNKIIKKGVDKPQPPMLYYRHRDEEGQPHRPRHLLRQVRPNRQRHLTARSLSCAEYKCEPHPHGLSDFGGLGRVKSPSSFWSLFSHLFCRKKDLNWSFFLDTPQPAAHNPRGRNFALMR